MNARGRASVEVEEEPLARPFAWEAMLSRAGSARLSRTLLAPHGGALPFDFRPGRVDAELLPRPVLRRAYGKVIDTQLAEIAHPNDLLGHRPLREAVARLPLGRGIIADADQLLIVGGSQSGLDLIARVLVDPGDAVGVEQPGYFVAMRMPSARRVQDWWA